MEAFILGDPATVEKVAHVFHLYLEGAPARKKLYWEGGGGVGGGVVSLQLGKWAWQVLSRSALRNSLPSL